MIDQKFAKVMFSEVVDDSYHFCRGVISKHRKGCLGSFLIIVWNNRSTQDLRIVLEFLYQMQCCKQIAEEIFRGRSGSSRYFLTFYESV